jgi:hypothetical protein
MRPLSNQSASTFFPHAVAALAGAAVESAATALRSTTTVTTNVRKDRASVKNAISWGAVGSPGPEESPDAG